MIVLTALLLVVFVLYVAYRELQAREGLVNQDQPVQTVPDQPGYIYSKLVDPSDPLYKPTNVNFTESEVINDMQYFNNATALLASMQQKNSGTS
jgi:hypothetical protein